MSYDSTVLADSPQGFWPLNEASGPTAVDATGHGHDGTYQGGVTLGQSGPCTDGETAPLFDGSSGYVTIPDQAALQLTGDLSLEAWVKPTDFSNYWMVITKDLSGGGATNPYELRLTTSTGVPHLLDFPTGGAGVEDTAATNPVSAGGWSHIVVTRTSSTGVITHYLNGTTNGGATRTVGPFADSGRPVYIGTRDDFFSFFKGLVAKAAVYNYVLSAAQILAHYNTGLQPPFVSPRGPALPRRLGPKAVGPTFFAARQSQQQGTPAQRGTLGTRAQLPRRLGPKAVGPTFFAVVRPPQPLLATVTYTDGATGTLIFAGSGAESKTGSNTQTGTLIFNGASAESKTGTDAQTGTRIFAGSGAESKTGTDTQTGIWILSGTRTDSNTSADAQTGILILAGSATSDTIIPNPVVTPVRSRSKLAWVDYGAIREPF